MTTENPWLAMVERCPCCGKQLRDLKSATGQERGYMEKIEAMMADLSKRHGKDGMRAIATLMYSLGSSTTINFDDGTWIPCDFLMQIAWAYGGAPETLQSIG